MGIAEILAARKAGQKAPPQSTSIFSEDILEDEVPESDDPPYLAPKNAKYLDNYRVNELFLAVMTPLIRSPYTMYGVHSEYYWWMLLTGDDNVHVLNTFPLIPEQVLFDAYMKYNPPIRVHHLHRLYVTITRLQLNMPPIYLPKILELIKTASIKPLDNPGFSGYTDT